MAYETDENFDIKSWLPFTGKIKLPTQMEVLKLVLFLRDEAGRKNQGVKAQDLYISVAEVVQKYWDRAGFKTKSRIEREVQKVHEEYQKLKKDVSRTTPGCVKAREMFLMFQNSQGEKKEKLFDVGKKDLEKTLEQDRILGNLGVTEDDINFLQDQRGERKAFMAEEDLEYRKKKEAQLKRRMGPAPAVPSSSQTSEASSLPDLYEEPDDGEDDSEDEERNRRPKRSKFVDVRVPRNIMASPQVTAAMDRTNTTPAKAMHLIAAVLKSAQNPKDGESLDLNEVFLSESTIRRGREKAREEINRQQYQEFQDNMPEFLALHWDGKMMKDLSDTFEEMEAILVSGVPGYKEGKLLGKNMSAHSVFDKNYFFFRNS